MVIPPSKVPRSARVVKTSVLKQNDPSFEEWWDPEVLPICLDRLLIGREFERASTGRYDFECSVISGSS